MNRQQVDTEPLLTPSEVAALFGVDTRTVSRWARAGRLTAVRTLGGHRRFLEREVRSQLEDSRPTDAFVTGSMGAPLE